VSSGRPIGGSKGEACDVLIRGGPVIKLSDVPAANKPVAPGIVPPPNAIANVHGGKCKEGLSACCKGVISWP